MATRNEIFCRVQGIICENQGKEPKDVKESSSLHHDMGMDSLDIMELGMEVQDKFKIEISDEELATFKTVGSVVDVVANKV